MKVDFNQFPAIKNLSEDVRKKAVEYAETLGARGPRPTTVLGTAVTLANEWKSGRLPARPVAVPFLVQPKNGRWVIKRSNSELASHVYMRKDDAVRRAQELAKQEGAACFVFGPGGTLIERYEARVLAAMEFPQVAEPVTVVPTEEPPAIPALAVPEVSVIEAAPAIAAAELTPAVEPVAVIAAAAPEIEFAELAPATTSEPVEVVGVEALEEAPIEPSPIAIDPIDPNDEPIRVKRVANKWLVFFGDGRSEALSTKAKAIKRAYELGKKLGRAVVA